MVKNSNDKTPKKNLRKPNTTEKVGTAIDLAGFGAAVAGVVDADLRVDGYAQAHPGMAVHSWDAATAGDWALLAGGIAAEVAGSVVRLAGRQQRGKEVIQQTYQKGFEQGKTQAIRTRAAQPPEEHAARIKEQREKATLAPKEPNL